jgi:cholest-4-en-3-one 26-monooxygenase
MTAAPDAPAAAALLDPARFADGPPHDVFDALRDGPPADSGPGPQGNRLWSVCSHAAIAEASRDTATFSSYAAGIFPHSEQVNPLDVNRQLLLFKDPPEHTKYRKILQTAFVPRSVAAIEPRVREIVAEVIDAVTERGSCDFVADVAVPVPLRVLADLMGLPPEDVPRLADWTDRIEQAQISTEPAAALPVLGEMAAYLGEQIAAQKEAGGDSLVTTLAGAEVDGESLDDTEILVFFALLVFAGNDTTRNTMSGGMLALLEHPDQLALLAAEPERVEAAVEEILRWTSVVNYFCRTATSDTELAGREVAAGEKVMLWYAAGSRDPEVNSDPHRFDVTRNEPVHMAFGGGGRHFCLGAGLARLNLRVTFEEVLRRMQGIELDGEPERLRSNWANGLTSLPIRFEPATKES